MKTTHIVSSDNAQYKQLKKLAESPRERRKQDLALLDGLHLLQALADTGGTPDVIIVRNDMLTSEEIQQCIGQFSESPILALGKNLFDALSSVETPTGILALIKIPTSAIQPCQLAVILENIQDPGNLGSILRTAAAAGAVAAFLSKGCTEAWSPKALRAGMGAQFSIAIHENADLLHAATLFDKIIATELSATTSLYECNLNGSLAFVFGNEGAGLSAEVLQIATHRVSIPMPGKVESLNVAAAAAICLFETVRQKQQVKIR